MQQERHGHEKSLVHDSTGLVDLKLILELSWLSNFIHALYNCCMNE